MRAPTVTAEGSLPEAPLLCAQAKTSWPWTWSGGLPALPKKVLDHAGVGVHGPVGTGSALLLAQERVEGAFPALGGVVEEREVGHGGASIG